MTRQQAEQELKDRKGKAYDPWIVDQFLLLLDKLEELEAEERRKASSGDAGSTATITPAQLDVISAATAEEREFNELRRELPRAETITAAADLLFKRLRRIVPAANLSLYLPVNETNEVFVVATAGIGASSVDGLRVPIGERISGWVFAHGQPVLNSDASLELGPIARGFSVPLRYASAVPIIDNRTVGVLAAFAEEPFEKDHRRLLENAATLFVASVTQMLTSPIRPELQAGEQPSKTSVH
jgi:signal transduction protein with GAF and PtsI domain